MAWSKATKTEAMIRCGRCCCICHKFCGTKIELHHITPIGHGGNNELDNAIALCFDCHADQANYDTTHPRGTRYSVTELLLHRDRWYERVAKGPGLAEGRQASAVDVQVFRLHCRLLPWATCIGVLESQPYNQGPLKSDYIEFLLYYDYVKCPHFEHIDPDLEHLRSGLASAISDYISDTCLLLYPSRHLGYLEVPHEWESGSPERYSDSVSKLTASSRAVVATYSDWYRLCVRKLATATDELSSVSTPPGVAPG